MFNQKERIAMVHKHFRIVIVSLISVLLLASFDVHAYSGGSGSKEDPWEISVVADWEKLMTTPDHWEMHFQLTSDLDFEDAVLSPIGYYDGPRFSGMLQGQGHILRNAVVRPGESTEMGLFGHLENAEVRDLVWRPLP